MSERDQVEELRAQVKSRERQTAAAESFLEESEAYAAILEADAERLRAENVRLTELWMDAVCQGSRQKKVGDEYRHFDGAISTWEEAFYELEKRGLAEGNERDGWVLKWPGEGKP